MLVKAEKYIPCLCFLLETWCVTYALKTPTLLGFASGLYIVCGISISVLTLRARETRQSLTFAPAKGKIVALKLLAIAFLAAAIFYYARFWIRGTPLTIYAADMIPVMKVQASRFLSGQWRHVYDPIPEIWGGIQPIYLPAMWLPFCAALLVHVDLRWVTAFGLFLSVVTWIWQLRGGLGKGMVVVFAGAGGLIWWLLTEPSHNFLRLTEEGIVVFYYSMLALALSYRNFILIGICIAMCLLSRYTLVGWLPALAFILIVIERNVKALVQTGAAALAMILLLLIIPFGIRPLALAWHLPDQYIQHAARVWKDNPEYFQNSIGLAKFFGPQNIVLLHRTLLIASFTIPILFVIICHFYEKRSRKKLSNIPIAALKVSLVTTLCLIDVPYPYLFFTSSFVSLFMMGWCGFIRRSFSEGGIIFSL